jgi:DNA-directed RNA polymerase beta' subunit
MFREELLKWLRAVCFYCGDVIVPIKTRVPAVKRLSESIKPVRTIKACPNCKQPHLQVIKDKKMPAIFYRVHETPVGPQKMEFFNNEIETVLQRVTDTTVIAMGKPRRCHPRKYILRSIRAPPNTIRPDLRRVGGSRSSNSDTTSLMKIIVELNDALPDEIPEHDKISKELKDIYFNLDMAYFAMIKGGGGGEIKMLTNMNKPPVSIAEHFPKKTGRIRRNLMGKRVEYMIRSVITGDSRLKLYEVGIPRIHAQNLEIPETVTEKNKDRLGIYFANKTKRYPGCKRIVTKSNGMVHRVDYLDENYQLQIGDVVFRDMITGDYVCMNRQPSLTFSSISGMRVVVMDNRSVISLNSNICAYYGADFDGDNGAEFES